MCLNAGLADAMVCGLTYATAEVALAATGIVGLEEGVSAPSSMFVMDVPGFEGAEGSMIALSDGGLCENPSADELADIAVVTARTVHKLLGWEPRVAMLSYSTSGSSLSEMTKKVISATELAHEKDPNLLVDGEMQLDAASRTRAPSQETTSDFRRHSHLGNSRCSSTRHPRPPQASRR